MAGTWAFKVLQMDRQIQRLLCKEGSGQTWFNFAAGQKMVGLVGHWWASLHSELLLGCSILLGRFF